MTMMVFVINISQLDVSVFFKTGKRVFLIKNTCIYILYEKNL